MGLKARGTRPAVCHQQLLRPAALVGLSKIFDSGTNSNLYHSLDSLPRGVAPTGPAIAILAAVVAWSLVIQVQDLGFRCATHNPNIA